MRLEKKNKCITSKNYLSKNIVEKTLKILKNAKQSSITKINYTTEDFKLS